MTNGAACMSLMITLINTLCPIPLKVSYRFALALKVLLVLLEAYCCL